jgi:hypothetical protein
MVQARQRRELTVLKGVVQGIQDRQVMPCLQSRHKRIVRIVCNPCLIFLGLRTVFNMIQMVPFRTVLSSLEQEATNKMRVPKQLLLPSLERESERHCHSLE